MRVRIDASRRRISCVVSYDVYLVMYAAAPHKEQDLWPPAYLIQYPFIPSAPEKNKLEEIALVYPGQKGKSAHLPVIYSVSLAGR